MVMPCGVRYMFVFFGGGGGMKNICCFVFFSLAFGCTSDMVQKPWRPSSESLVAKIFLKEAFGR